jgi:hypothetical protein
MSEGVKQTETAARLQTLHGGYPDRIDFEHFFALSSTTGRRQQEQVAVAGDSKMLGNQGSLHRCIKMTKASSQYD